MVGNYQKLGFSDGKQLLLLLPQKKTSYYAIKEKRMNKEKIPVDEPLLEEAIAYYQAAYYVLSRNLYKK